MHKIIAKAPLWIKFPSTPGELQMAKNEWRSKFNIPTCIGALDCVHVKINKPGPNNNGDDYINRKLQASINVQATCNAREWFTSVDANWPGSVHDSRIWKNSEERKFMETTKDTILIADSGYGIAPWLLPPYKNPTSPQQLNFNKVYARDRVIIERCFGQVKRRFPILHYKVRVTLRNVSNIIICCFVLHNIAKYLADPYEDFPEIDDQDEDEADATPMPNNTRIRELGKQKRDQIADILFNRN